MNHNNFLNKQVINKNNQVGVVVSFDKEHIVIKYANEEKTYNPDVAFKTGFLTFINKDLKSLINKDLTDKDIAAKKREEELEEVNKKYFSKKRKINETYQRMKSKNGILLSLFGKDFIYPPFKQFEKKYKLFIEKNKKTLTRFFDDYGYYDEPWLL